MSSRLDNSTYLVDESDGMRPTLRGMSGFCTLIFVMALWASPGFSQQMTSVARANRPDPPSANMASPRALPSEYVIGPTDVLDISVWKEPEISRTVTVRPDGKISLPLAGELDASGQTPLQLQTEISTRLTKFITNPGVTVLLHDVRSGAVNIFGKVAKPGSYALTKQMTVLDVIAAAGGFKDYAGLSKIYVLRVQDNGGTVRYKFNFKQVIKGVKLSQNILLKPRDTIYVP